MGFIAAYPPDETWNDGPSQTLYEGGPVVEVIRHARAAVAQAHETATLVRNHVRSGETLRTFRRAAAVVARRRSMGRAGLATAFGLGDRCRACSQQVGEVLGTTAVFCGCAESKAAAPSPNLRRMASRVAEIAAQGSQLLG